MATIEDFHKIDMRTGRIIEVLDFPEARKPAYRITIDFGKELGIKRSCAQLPANYTKEKLVGRQVIAVVNLPPRQIGPAVSEVLTLGVSDENGNCVLVVADSNAPLGGRLY